MPPVRLTEIAEAHGIEWALGFLARARALLGEGQIARLAADGRTNPRSAPA